MTKWTGVFPAVTTKLSENGEIDVEATQSSINRLIENGVSGVIVLPMLGENASMSIDEKVAVIEAAKETVNGRVPLLTGLAEITSTDAVARARQFHALGVDGLMVFPSIGYKTDARETEQWYRAVASASPLPIMVYNNPIAYGVDVTPEILQALSDCETIVAVKEETGDVRRVTDMFVALGDRYRIFCGVDDQIVESMSLGSVGWVSGMTNAWPKECVGIFDLCTAGRYEEAREIYRILTPAFHLDTHVKLVQYIKLAEHVVYGAPEWCRAPRLALVGDERERVLSILRNTVSDLDAYATSRAA
ncbi:MAG: dihydrodipicolinate synthase family protein [Roseitalea sp.]|nr:dihydrodipicolinate synthase family protein [Roseitalea sp.]MBO6722670.1 dihydrodipicolinate synthase family protein [Roseitalea sp.]MBO6741546.1 dihydrodipicolinate synthase family protein [Roseitalea sp.]